jgi:hypothetical protein
MLTSVTFARPLRESVGRMQNEISIQTLQYLKTGYSRIKDNEDGTLAVSGNTEAYQAVDAISVTLYLEVYDGGTWEVVTSWTNIAYGTNEVSGLHEHAVESGQTYRARGVHEVWEGGVHERGTSYTGGITP